MCPHCSHHKPYKNRAGLVWHWKHRCTGIDDEAKQALKNRQSGRPSRRERFLLGGFKFSQGKEVREREPGVAGKRGSEALSLYGSFGAAKHIVQSCPQAIDAAPAQACHSPRLQERAAEANETKKAELQKERVEAVTRSIFDYLFPGRAELWNAKGAARRDRSHGMKINVRSRQEPTPKLDAFLEQEASQSGGIGSGNWTEALAFLRTRRGSPSTCMCQRSVEPVCLWDPSTYFPEIEVRCWHCRSKNVKVKGWTDGKTIDGINGTYRFYAKRMKCMNPSCKMPFQSDDEGYLKMLGSRIQEHFRVYCGHHTHNVSYYYYYYYYYYVKLP